MRFLMMLSWRIQTHLLPVAKVTNAGGTPSSVAALAPPIFADDVGFLRSLIMLLCEQFDVDPDRVFLVGFSNGAFMAQRFAAEQPGLVRAVVAAAGTIGTATRTLRPSGPVPILLTHGMQDHRVRYDGGASPGDPEFVWKSFDETVKAWRLANGCVTPPTVTLPTQSAEHQSQLRRHYADGAAALETIEYRNNGHQWDGWRIANVWSSQTAASQEAARFIAQFE
jgi:polyhydroxybutyrate depolymerase